MNLEEAETLAMECLRKLAPVCERIEIVGSVRRRRGEVGDIDIILIPKADRFSFRQAVGDLLGLVSSSEGEKMKSGHYQGVQVDIYIATPETWDTLLLIRTGSKEHNIRLTSLAKRKGWKLHANGTGLVNERGQVIATEEKAIFQALGIAYLPPEARDPERYQGMWRTA